MKNYFLAIVLLACGTFVYGDDGLYRTFSNPDMKYRPQVRWWWNGDKVTAHEILRELDIMKAAGIGGVEKNRFSDLAICSALVSGVDDVH